MNQNKSLLTLMSAVFMTLLGTTGCSDAISSMNEQPVSPTPKIEKFTPEMEMSSFVEQLNETLPEEEEQFSILVNEVIERIPTTLGLNPEETVKALYRVVRVGKDPTDRKKSIISLSTLEGDNSEDAEIVIPKLIELLGNIEMRPDDPTTTYYELRSTIHMALGMRGFGKRTTKHLKEIFQDARNLDADRAQAVLVGTKLLSKGDDGGLFPATPQAKEILEILLEVMDIPAEKGFSLRLTGRTNPSILESLKYLGAEAQPALVKLKKEFKEIQDRVFSDQNVPGDRDHGALLLHTIQAIEAAI